MRRDEAGGRYVVKRPQYEQRGVAERKHAAVQDARVAAVSGAAAAAFSKLFWGSTLLEILPGRSEAALLPAKVGLQPYGAMPPIPAAPPRWCSHECVAGG